MIYWALFLVFILAGLFLWPVSTRKFAVNFILLGIAAVPSGSIFENHVIHLGLYVFFGAPLGLVIGGVLLILVRNKIEKGLILRAIPFLILVSLFISNFDYGVNLLRDSRAYLMLAVVLVAAVFIGRIYTSIDIRYVFKIFKLAIFVAFVKSMLLFFLVRYYDLNTSVSEDPFLVGDVRANQWYGDLSVHLGVAWLLIFARKFPVFDLFSFAMIIATGSRSLLVVTLLIYITSMRVNRINLSMAVVFVGMSTLVLMERIIGSDIGVGASFLVRYSPFVDSIRNMSDWQFLFGHGFGYGFEIPWFEYRNIDSSFNYVDSLYLTLFAKFGLLSILVLILLYKMTLPCLGYSKKFVWYFLLMGITTSLVYQSVFPLALFIYILSYHLIQRRQADV